MFFTIAIIITTQVDCLSPVSSLTKQKYTRAKPQVICRYFNGLLFLLCLVSVAGDSKSILDLLQPHGVDSKNLGWGVMHFGACSRLNLCNSSLVPRLMKLRNHKTYSFCDHLHSTGALSTLSWYDLYEDQVSVQWAAINRGSLVFHQYLQGVYYEQFGSPVLYVFNF